MSYRSQSARTPWKYPAGGVEAPRRQEPAGRDADGLEPLLLPGLVVLAGQLPGRVDRLRPSGDEERPVQVARGERGDPLGELDRARMGVRPVGIEGQLPHLLE